MSKSLHPIVIFFWGYILFVRVPCRDTLGILNESKLSEHKELCFRRCDIGFHTDDNETSSKEIFGRRSCYERCLREDDMNSAKNELRAFADEQKMSFLKRIRRDALKVAGKPNPGIMYGYLHSRLNKQKESLHRHTMTFFKREKRETASGQAKGKIVFTNDAEKCFKPKGDKDTIFKPDFVNLTFEELNSHGIYRGKISWKPHSDNELDWTEYRVIYAIRSKPPEKLLWLKCVDLKKKFTSYTIPLELKPGWEINVLVALLPYSTGYTFSVSSCTIPVGGICTSSREPASNPTKETFPFTNETASNPTKETFPLTNDAKKCFKPKRDNDTIFKPDSVSLTFEELNSHGIYIGKISWKPHSDNELDWTEYRVIYEVRSKRPEKLLWLKCVDLKKKFTSYPITLGLEPGWEINVLVALLPYSTGDTFSLSSCTIPVGGICTSSRETASNPTKETIPLTNGNKKTIAIIVGPVVSTALLVCGIVVVCQVWRFHRRSKTDEALPPSMSDQEFEYDAFVIFSSKDTDWVKKTLIPTLEKKHGLKCCIHYRNFTPGVLFRDNVVESVYKCRKIVAVVSSHFFKSNYCGSELDFALHRLLEKRDDSLVVIKLDEVDKKNLPIELQERSYIDYSKSVERKEWEKKLVNCLKKKKAVGETNQM